MTNASDKNRLEDSRLVSSFRARILFFLALTAFFSSSSVFAVYPFTDAEYAMLPEYCRHQGNVSENHRATNTTEWRVTLGEDFEPIHHWCAVYMWMGRAHKAGVSSNEGRSMLGKAEADTNYFLKRMGPNSPRATETYTRLGEINLLQGRPREAEFAFMRAHEISPTRWQPYLFWGQHLYKTGRVADARREITAGLEYSPDNKALKSFLAEMNAGKRGDRK